MIVDQGKDADFYWQNYTPALARIVLRLHLDNIYHSPAYIGIIGLILISLTVRTFRRVIPARLPAAARGEDRADSAARVGRRSNGDEADVRARIAAVLRRARLADPQARVRRRGVDVRRQAQLGAARRAGRARRFRHHRRRHDDLLGDRLQRPVHRALRARPRRSRRPARRSRSSASVTASIRSRPRAGSSTSRSITSRTRTVTGKDGVARDAVIRVNQPYDVDGVEDLSGDLRLRRSRSCSRTTAGRSPVRRATPMQGRRCVRRSPGRRARSSTASSSARSTAAPASPAPDPRPNDPGRRARGVRRRPAARATSWSRSARRSISAPATRSTPQHYTLYSGFQYRYDPGIPLVLIGAIVLLAGPVHLVLLPARAAVRRRSPAPGASWNVGIAATTVKGYDIFEDRFRDIVDALRRTPPTS